MDEQRIGVAQLWSTKQKRVLLDVRTPDEYAKGHIPDAINFPLFENHERAEVGTLYKKVSPREAFLRGLELVGPKMADFIRQAELLAPAKQLLIHCWRGGQRSDSLAWLLRRGGFDVRVIEGGYKAYRQWLHRAFDKACNNFLVLGGLTGSGKTMILREIQASGEQVIDLECIARHKGSSFGALGELHQPTVEQFENDLYEVYQKMDFDKTIWMEHESRSIGRIYLPAGFWNNLTQAPLIDLQIPFEDRLDILVGEYARYPKSMLKQAFDRIRKRLGGQHLKAAHQAIDAEDFREAAAIALRYYDKSYRFFMERSPALQTIPFKVEKHDPKQTAAALIRLSKKHRWLDKAD